MDQTKGISIKIDEAIESFLKFSFRYLSTFWLLLISPHKPQKILNHGMDNPPTYVRPLTFLSIGAFFFTLLISVYPVGLTGILDLIWFIDEIKEEVRKNWQKALSVSNLFVMGMPAIVTITGFSSLIGRLLFKNPGARVRWFEANCYIFGFQMLVLFLCLSLDSVLYGLSMLFPAFDPDSYGTEGLFSTIIMSLFFCVVLAGLLWPYIFLGACLFKLKEFVLTKNRPLLIIITLVYGLGMQYLYTASASVFPGLEQKYLDEIKEEVITPVANLQVLSIEVDSGDREGKINMAIESLLINPYERDLYLDFNDLDVELFIGLNDDDQEKIWNGEFVKLDKQSNKANSNTLIIEAKSLAPIEMQFSFSLNDIRSAFCILNRENTQARKDELSIKSLYLSLDGQGFPEGLYFESKMEIGADKYEAMFLKNCP